MDPSPSCLSLLFLLPLQDHLQESETLLSGVDHGSWNFVSPKQGHEAKNIAPYRLGASWP